MKRKSSLRSVVPSSLTVAIVMVMFTLSACTTDSGPQAVEIREYQGERLSGTDDFRENSIKGPQKVALGTYTLGIEGLVDVPQDLSYDAVKSYPSVEKLVTLYCVEGWDATILWKGARVSDLLAAAKVRKEANTVIFHAYDGYTTSLPLEYVQDRGIILAYEMNNITLPPERGFPFQLVAEDKWGYKWIKWVTRIELTDDPSYKGYWESRGYSSNGDKQGPIFEKG